jgi:hypothetical protein
MTFTVFHHASIRVPGRLERPSAVGRLHRAGGGPFFFVVVVVVLVVVVVVFEKVRENAREASATPKRSRSNHARYFSP